MAKLNDLTVSLLDKLANECGISFKKSAKKKEKIQTIKKAKIPEDHLNDLINKYLAQKSLKRKSSKDIILELRGRIRLLEDQVKFLMSKIKVSEVKVSKDKDREIITVESDLEDIKKYIKSLLSSGESITIDELIDMRELQKIPMIALKHAVYELIEEDVFDTMEGNSRQKLGGKIGVLTKK